MIERTHPSLRAGVDRKGARLSVYVRAAGFLVAIDSELVVRLMLADEITGAVARPKRGPSAIAIGDRWYPAASLSEILGVSRPAQAVILLQAPRRSDLIVALLTGPCVKVAALPAVSNLPSGIAGGAAHAFRGAFPVATVQGGVAEALTGLVLDAGRLWTDAELQAMDAAAREHADGGGWRSP